MLVAPLDPIGPELADKNRRILAERLSWPDGAVQACERIDKACPGWDTVWSAGGSLRWVEPGFYSTHPDLTYGSRPRRWLYGATEDEMLTVISDNEPISRWDLMDLRSWTTDR